jgi:hypothetical protein
MVTKTFNIDLDITNILTTKYNYELVQNDVGTYLFNITMYNGASLLNLTTVSSATITFKKYDGNVVVGSAIISATPSNGVITYTLGTSEISYPGMVNATIELFSSTGDRLTSNKFSFNVRAELGSDSSVISSTEYPVLTQLISDTTTAIDNSETATTNCENITDECTNIIGIAEGAISEANEILNTDFTGSYSASTQYYKNNIATYNGYAYMAVQNTINHAPPTHPTTSNTWWAVIDSIRNTIDYANIMNDDVAVPVVLFSSTITAGALSVTSTSITVR